MYIATDKHVTTDEVAWNTFTQYMKKHADKNDLNQRY